MPVVSYFVLKQECTQPSLWRRTASRTCKNHNTWYTYPKLLCNVLWCVCVCVCVCTYTHKIYIRGRGIHNNLVSRMRPAGRGLQLHVLKVWHFTSLPKPLRLRINYKIFSVLLLNPEHGSRMFLRNIVTLYYTTTRCHNLGQCFSTFVKPRTGNFFFIRREPGPNKFTRRYLSDFF
jgi:hypothetical protein